MMTDEWKFIIFLGVCIWYDIISLNVPSSVFLRDSVLIGVDRWHILAK